MKKVFAIVLIVCLAMTAVFADKGDFKVGAQVGFGTLGLSVKKDSDNYLKVKNSGFYFAGTAEYDFSDALAGKVEFGLNTMGKAKTTLCVLGVSTNSTASDPSPMQLSAYVGLQYNIELTKELDLGLGAGWDMMIGKETNADDAKTNAAMGVGFEVVAAYKLNKSTALTLGSKIGLLFINSDDDIADAYSTATDNDWKVSQNSLKFFAGVVFSL